MIWDLSRFDLPQTEEEKQDGPPELLFVHGGHNGNEWLDDFFLLDTESLVWKEIKSYNYVIYFDYLA